MWSGCLWSAEKALGAVIRFRELVRVPVSKRKGAGPLSNISMHAGPVLCNTIGLSLSWPSQSVLHAALGVQADVYAQYSMLIWVVPAS